MKHTNFNVAWKRDPMFHSWLIEDRTPFICQITNYTYSASKRNFKCKICLSSLELGNMGRGSSIGKALQVRET